MLLNIFKIVLALIGGLSFIRQCMIRRRIYTKFLDLIISKKKGEYYKRLLLAGKTIIITGANSGIGEAATYELAKHGAKVIMACRDLQKATTAKDNIISKILKSHPDDDSLTSQHIDKPVVEYSFLPKYPNIVIEKLDLSDLESVRTFANRILEKEQRIDVLLNNAGLMQSFYTKTAQGYENAWGTNHLGHFYLTLLLLPLIYKTAKEKVTIYKNSPYRQGSDNLTTSKNRSQSEWSQDIDNCLTNTRIVIVASTMHKNLTKNLECLKHDLSVQPNDLDGNKNYNYWRAYSRSKLCNILFANELARRLKTGQGLQPFLETSIVTDLNDDMARCCEGGNSSFIPVAVNSLHPGIVVTNMSRNLKTHNDFGKYLYVKFGHLFFKNPYQGCQTSVFCSVAPELNNITGTYFGACQIHESTAATHDEKLAKYVWEYSLKCIENFENSKKEL